jgi:hypothetical protein
MQISEVGRQPRAGRSPSVSSLFDHRPTNYHIWSGTAPATRRAEEYTVAMLPDFSGVEVPAELSPIAWQKEAGRGPCARLID